MSFEIVFAFVILAHSRRAAGNDYAEGSFCEFRDRAKEAAN
jgi:hypothetical protein